MLGDNILGSYAADWAERNPDVGIVMPKDYTVLMLRIGLVPTAANSSHFGRHYLEYSMLAEGQKVIARQLHIAVVSPESSEKNSVNRIQEVLGGKLPLGSSQSDPGGLSRPSQV